MQTRQQRKEPRLKARVCNVPKGVPLPLEQMACATAAAAGNLQQEEPLEHGVACGVLIPSQPSTQLQHWQRRLANVRSCVHERSSLQQPRQLAAVVPRDHRTTAITPRSSLAACSLVEVQSSKSAPASLLSSANVSSTHGTLRSARLGFVAVERRDGTGECARAPEMRKGADV